VHKQLPHETIEQIISVALMNLSALIFYYIPIEQVAEKQEKMFRTLLQLLEKEGIEESLKTPIVDNLSAFVSEQGAVNLAVSWVETSNVFVPVEGGDDKILYKLNKKQKISFVKAIYRDA
jgi:ADP-heptose:LPS heptosyltransferase